MRICRRFTLFFLSFAVLAPILPLWSAETPQLMIDEIRVVSWKPPLYHGWPTLAKRRNGELLLAFSGGREAHVCPFGRLELMRSKDDGESWGWPQVIHDCPIDDRDAGIMETPRGAILMSNFTSLEYARLYENAIKIAPDQPGAWDAVKQAEWRAAHERLTADERRQELGTWMWRSEDGGVNWSARYRVPCHSPHGPIALADGQLIYCGIAMWNPDRTVGAWESRDDGLTWKLIGKVPARPGDDLRNYHELHAVECRSKKLVAQIRNENAQNPKELLQTESTDGGKTWSVPHATEIWGLPPHLIRLQDSRLLLTYGYRRSPYGVRARISRDEGDSWSDPMPISADGTSPDLGYPSTVECQDGTFVTVWYERLKESELAQLRQARWHLK